MGFPFVMQAGSSVTPNIIQFLKYKNQIARSHVQKEKMFGEDILSLIMEFFHPKEIALLMEVCQGWMGHISLTRNFVQNKICIILDNTTSMNIEAQTIQRQFLDEFLAQIDIHAKISLRIICPSPSPRLSPFQHSLPENVTSKQLVSMFRTDPILIPSFYIGTKTPLFQSICDALTEGFKVVLCLTDGEENQAHSLKDLKLFHKSLHSLEESQSQSQSQPFGLVSFMQTLVSILPSNQIFLPSIIGLNMNPPKAEGLVPIFSLSPHDNMKSKVESIRKSSIPKEAGGGKHTCSSVILHNRRYHQTNPKLRTCFKNHWRFFPEPENRHCVSLLIAYRHAHLLTLPVTLQTSWKPSFTEKKQGWFFRYAAEKKSVAIAELKQTHDLALQLFNSLTEKQMETLMQEVISYNWTRYMKCLSTKPNKPKRKRKREDSTIPKVLKEDIKLLERSDFEKILTDNNSEITTLIRCIPKSCYPISLTTFFWLVQINESNDILHDIVLNVK